MAQIEHVLRCIGRDEEAKARKVGFYGAGKWDDDAAGQRFYLNRKKKLSVVAHSNGKRPCIQICFATRITQCEDNH